MLLISENKKISLTIETNNRIHTEPPLPVRHVITASHLRAWGDYGSGHEVPQLSEIENQKFWKIEGSNRVYRLISASEIYRKVRPNEGYQITPFILTLDIFSESPEEEAAKVSPAFVKTHLRRFGNLILDEE